MPADKLWNYLRRLFQSAETSSLARPFLHEVLRRDAEQKADFEQWQESLMRRRMTDWLADQYAVWLTDPERLDEAIDFLDTPSSKGFVIHFHKTRYNRREVTHLFEYLHHKVHALDYRRQHADVRTYQREGWVETVERYHLKPRVRTGDGDKLNQRFGNITIELTLRNDRVFNLKFRANTYSDRAFQEADSFGALMQALLKN